MKCVKCGQSKGIGMVRFTSDSPNFGYFKDGELHFYKKGDLRHIVCPKNKR